MAQRLALSEEKLAQRAGVTKSLSLGWLVAAAIGGIATVIIWTFNPALPLIPVVSVAASSIFLSLITYLLARYGRIRFAGYFFVAYLILQSAVVTILFGGFAGPMTIIYLLPILVASMVIGIKASFLAASVVVVVFLAAAGAEQEGLFLRLAIAEVGDEMLLYLAIIAHVVLFYLVAFLSWYASSRLQQALQGVRRYAGKLQTANEKLQTSEGELRASNEELEAANEELRATEEELRSSNEELETANDELKEAQEQMVRSEKLAAIGQLAGGVGHELRNPLGAIKNAVYYIKGKVAKSDLAQTEPRVMEFLEIADDEINSSDKIISDLLSFSRVGKPAVSPARIDKVIDDAVSHVQIPENIELTMTADANLPDVEIDTDQIRQVLVNIITNAVQAMPEGGKLAIRATGQDSLLEMEVADTGSGIPEGAIGKIFDPLYTMKAKDIGLGLAVCKSIIDRHKGNIGVESKEGEGTVFTIKLPLKSA